MCQSREGNKTRVTATTGGVRRAALRVHSQRFELCRARQWYQPESTETAAAVATMTLPAGRPGAVTPCAVLLVMGSPSMLTWTLARDDAQLGCCPGGVSRRPASSLTQAQTHTQHWRPAAAGGPRIGLLGHERGERAPSAHSARGLPEGGDATSSAAASSAGASSAGLPPLATAWLRLAVRPSVSVLNEPLWSSPYLRLIVALPPPSPPPLSQCSQQHREGREGGGGELPSDPPVPAAGRQAGTARRA